MRAGYLPLKQLEKNMEMNELLQAAVDSQASDVLLVDAAPPMFRIDGSLQSTQLEQLTPALLKQLCEQIATAEQLQQLEQEADVDFALSIPTLGRFRVNLHLQNGSYAAAIRLITGSIPDLSDLGLPPAIEQLTRLNMGLVLVTGQTGSGKSTTLAAMIDQINRRDAKHIITLEDPIEFQFRHRRAVVEQREINTDCPSFASGLRHVLRQDPDVILVGELRDLDTIRTTLQAAETGHLVLATLHSSSAPGAIDRIIEVFPADEQAQIRTHLAECLRAVVTQRLLPRAGGSGRVAAQEILVITRAVQNHIREGTSHMLNGVMSVGRKHGMQTMEQAMQQLLINGEVDPEDLESALREATQELVAVEI